MDRLSLFEKNASLTHHEFIINNMTEQFQGELNLIDLNINSSSIRMLLSGNIFFADKTEVLEI